MLRQQQQQQQAAPRGARVLYMASFAFCTAAFVTGLSFIFALHLGLEALALYHPHLQHARFRCLPLPQQGSHPVHAASRTAAATAFGSSARMPAYMQGRFSRAASLAQLEVAQAQDIIMDAPVKGQAAKVHQGAAFLQIDPSRYKLKPALSAQRNPLPWQAGQNSSSRAGAQGALSRDDFLAAIVTSASNEHIVKTGRLWRQGLRAFVASNESLAPDEAARSRAEGEAWGTYPDDQPLHTLALQGDSRAALAPFLAHRHYGDTYKWLFYGDDDTMFFPDAAANVLQHLDPDLPYFLTDHAWWTAREYDPNEMSRGFQPAVRSDTRHPHPAAPLCVPCNYARSISRLPWPAPTGCPCTPELLCAADTHGVLFKGARGKCGMPRVPTHTLSVHGGAGAILSVGLLRAIPFEWFEDCVTTTYSTGGDALISICIWQAGFGMTAPDPLWHPDNASMFDVGDIAQGDGADIRLRVARVLDTLLAAAAGACAPGSTCRLELDHFLTLHLRSRKFPSAAAYAQTVRVLTALYARVHDRPAPDAPAAPKDEYIDQMVELGIQVKRRQLQLDQGSGEAAGKPAAPTLSLESWLRRAEARAAEGMGHEILTAIFERYPGAA